jgi:hypothetical protein
LNSAADSAEPEKVDAKRYSGHLNRAIQRPTSSPCYTAHSLSLAFLDHFEVMSRTKDAQLYREVTAGRILALGWSNFGTEGHEELSIFMTCTQGCTSSKHSGQ